MSFIEMCFLTMAVCAVVATYHLTVIISYWMAKQRAMDKKREEIQERGFE